MNKLTEVVGTGYLVSHFNPKLVVAWWFHLHSYVVLSLDGSRVIHFIHRPLIVQQRGFRGFTSNSARFPNNQ